MRKGKEEVKTVKLGRLEDGEKVQPASANRRPNRPSPP
jgi:serine protease Do